MNALHLEVQNPENWLAPDQQQLQAWLSLALQQEYTAPVECALRIVSETEGRALNQQFRQRDYATNVLSFPNVMADLDEAILQQLDHTYLGDLVMCAPVVLREAAEQDKSVTHHWAHLLIHGALHLQGFDHAEAQQAEAMEALEINILNQLGIPNPY